MPVSTAVAHVVALLADAGVRVSHASARQEGQSRKRVRMKAHGCLSMLCLFLSLLGGEMLV